MYIAVMRLDPANSIVSQLGRVSAVARSLGLQRQAVYKWMLPKSKGGTGGTVPQRHHVAILDLARARDIPLTAADFLPSYKEGDQ